MLTIVAILLSIFLTVRDDHHSSLFPVVHAQTPYSSNPDDYDFGWIPVGVYDEGSEPVCQFCVNALGDPNLVPSDGDATKGPYWNRTVGLFRCDGVQQNELWAYQDSTKAIVFSNFTFGIFCVDAEFWNSARTLRMHICNSSLSSQRWTKQGNRLISGLESSDPLFLVGSVPTDDNPTNQQYAFYLSLETSLPNPVAGSLFSSNFTFLSSKNLIDKTTNNFTTEGLLKTTNSSVNSIVNGGFEKSTIQAGSDFTHSDWVQRTPSYFALCGWVIDYGPIEYVKAGYIKPAKDTYSVHLNSITDGPHRGSISQTFVTGVDNEYHLSFFMAGFPLDLNGLNRTCSGTYTTSKEARVQVRITNASPTDLQGNLSAGTNIYQQNFTFDVSSTSSTQPGWAIRNVSFVALTNVTTVSLISLNFNDSCGPMIDEVSVSLVRPGKSDTVWIVVGSLVAVAVLFAASAAFVYGRRRCPAEEDPATLFKNENTRVFSERELSVATKNFSSVLGEGGFGTVYKAEFPDGTTGAVKVEKIRRGLNPSSKTLIQDEIAVLLRVHHRNLVNLIGFCVKRGRYILVFEYLPNGSVYDRLHQSVLSVPPAVSEHSKELKEEVKRLSGVYLPWEKRVKIACDVAYGLEYLHHDADPPIVHRDVKSQNILLTATDSAKLADFGLSKAAPADAVAFQSIETMVRGSIGYLDPQYFQTGVFSSKSDVYSYGVVLLELISGHQAIYNAASLASWATPNMIDPSRYHALVDEKLSDTFDHKELQSLVELSKMCMQEESKFRPNMRQVVAFLMSNGLVVVGASIEQVPETLSRENYHKMHANRYLEIDTVSKDSTLSSFDDFLPMSNMVPSARD